MPIFLRNSSHITVGLSFTTGVGCRLDCIKDENGNVGKIVIGDNVQLNDYCHIASVSNVTIESNVLIASKVFITDHNHGIYNGKAQSHYSELVGERKLQGGKVWISENCWLGEGVVVLPNVFIGRNCIIAANSVVTRDIPENSIVGGVPARVLKTYRHEEEKWM